MKTRLVSEPESHWVAELLRNQEVVALPTETVYGLAGNATDPQAVAKIFAAKERPSFDPLIVHVTDQILQKSSPLAELIHADLIDDSINHWNNRDSIDQIMRQFWPGPLTLILPRGSKIPDAVTSGQSTVGIRCPAHPLFQKILHSLSFPLAAPSANRFGRISPTSAEHVLKELDGRIPAILDGGPCLVGVESTIVKITENECTLLRPGKISKTELQPFFKTNIQSAPSLMESTSVLAPGMLDEHYAPRKPLFLFTGSFEDLNTLSLVRSLSQLSTEKIGVLAMKGIHPQFKCGASQLVRTLSPKGSLEEMAHELFRSMRELDESNQVSVIIADSPPALDEGLGATLFDRLKRASRNKPTLPPPSR